MEVGKLTVPVSADLGPINRDLDRLRQRLGQANQSTVSVGRAMNDVTRQTSALTIGLKSLGAALVGVFSINAIRQFSDEATQMNNALRVSGLEGSNLEAVYQRLYATAQKNYTGTDALVKLYGRAALVQNELGVSTEELLGFTENVAVALRVAGTDSQSASGALLQLSQALGAGTVRAEEFNSILEGAPTIARAAAAGIEETGGSVAKLRQLVVDGKISSSEFFQGFQRGAKMLQEQVANSTPTIAQGFVTIRNALVDLTRTMNDTTGASGTIAKALIWVGENLQRIVSYATAAAALFGGQFIASVIAARVATLSLSSALALLRSVLIRTGIGALVVAVGEFINIMLEARQASESWGEAFALVSKRIEILIDAVKLSFEAAGEYISGVWYTTMADILSVTQSSVGSILSLVSALGPVGSAMASAIQVGLNQVGGSIDQLTKRGETLKELAKQTATVAGLQFGNALAGFEGGVANVPGGDGLRRPAAVDGGKAGKKSAAEREAERLAKAYADLVSDSQAFVAAQEIERQAIGMTELEAAKLRAQYDLLNQARRAGITLTPEEEQSLRALADSMAEAEVATKKLQERYDFAKDTFKGFFTDMKSELQNGASIWEAFGTAAANALQKIADKVLDMALNGIFDMIFGAFGGGGGLGNLIMPNIFAYADGTSYAPGGWSVVGERGPELMKLPGGTQVQSNNRVMSPTQASFGGGNDNAPQRVAIEVFVKDDGKIGAIARQEASSVVEVSIKDYDTKQLPESFHRVNNFQRMR